MHLDMPVVLVIAAVVTSAMAVAASLDQSIKQLPARRAIGALAYSKYSQATDLRNGALWYLPLVAAWVVVTLAASISGWGDHPRELRALALAAMFVGVAAHILVTVVFAAPALLAQRSVAGDEQALERVFDRFERWQTIQALIDIATLGASVWALLATLSDR